MPKKTPNAGNTLFDQADPTEPSAWEDLGGGIKTFRETGQIPHLTGRQRRFLGMTAPPEWEKDWFPLSEGEQNLALRGITRQIESRPDYAIYEAPRAHAAAVSFMISSTLLNAPLNVYKPGTQSDELDIRRDPEALESIAKVLVVQEASADGVWPRQGTKKFATLVGQKIADLTGRDQETVLELAAKVGRANRSRANFWQAEIDKLEATTAWRATQTDSRLARRNDGR